MTTSPKTVGAALTTIAAASIASASGAAKSVVKAALIGAAVKGTIEFARAMSEGVAGEDLVKAAKRGVVGGVLTGTSIGVFTAVPVLKDAPSTLSGSIMATSGSIGKALFDKKPLAQITRLAVYGALEVASSQFIKSTIK